jgi:carboxynorspermidine decarboxylase
MTLPLAIPSAALHDVPSPCFVIDETLIERNLQIIDRVQRATGATILLALKGFAAWHLFPLIRKYLPGVTCSGLHEALLGAEHFKGQIHTYAPAYTDEEIDQLIDLSDHLIFNSLSQWRRFRGRVREHPNPPACGLRINPQHSEVTTALYDPCAPGSRLGITAAELAKATDTDLDGITGLHAHTLCELNSDALARTAAAIEHRFAPWLGRMQWINFGGGHHITRGDYDIDLLIATLNDWQSHHGHRIFLEPGEAVALNSGVLLASVLDIVHNEVEIAILDVSATAHMPDVLEMPYRPEVEGAGQPGEKPHTYRLAGLSCLAGDVIGDYSFDQPLTPGHRLAFGDMAHYSMVKTTFFNGVKHPAIAIHNSRTGQSRIIRSFGYEDYRDRLG